MLTRTALALLMAVVGLNTPAFSQAPSGPQLYIVVLQDDPALRYNGSIPGYPATRPAPGKKIDPTSPNVRRYVRFLQVQHTRLLTVVGAPRSNKVYNYVYVINGFAAWLTEAQALALAKHPDVLWVAPDQMWQLATDASPDFLELTEDDGAWAIGYDGTGVVVGIIDSGIWPEHPSFFDDGSFFPPPVTLVDVPHHPACDFGNTSWNPNDAPFECNNKLIGARKYLDSYKRFVGLEREEYDSARDDNGHGTHTASTAAGNAAVEAVILEIERGSVSGMAPRAHVVAYKACGQTGCLDSDTAAAIDQAVADGVDVINYSIGGGPTLITATSIAFLLAADAGVFVATSAGNAGPEPGSVGAPAVVPWITAVGASTHDRAFISEITLEGPVEPPTAVWGASVTPGVTGFNLVDAEGLADASGDTTGRCLDAFLPDTFQPNDAVLCNQYEFGVARVERVNNVKEGGGGGVLFHNSPAVSVMPTDNHVLPTVHMLNDVGQPLKDILVANPGQVTVGFNAGEALYADADQRVIANAMASFSARGPNAAAADIIKPDVTAPGISILAGTTPTALLGAPDQYFQAILGTSMSSPHVAGVYALLKQAHPDWSPAMARSALMTTAYREDMVKEDFVTPADAFDMGAGHINPEDAAERGSLFEPGLVYDTGYLDYVGFLCDEAPENLTDPESICASLESLGIPTKAIDLNYPSLGIASVTGSQTVVRTLTRVISDRDRRPRKFRAAVESPPGYKVAVSPPTLRLKPGHSASYEITVTNVDAPVNEWRFGSITWEDRRETYAVHSPLAVRASLFEAPDEVSGEGADGTVAFDVSFGYTGDYSALPHGLEPVAVSEDNVLQDADQLFDLTDVETGGANLHEFELAGATVLRIALPPESTEPGADLDVFVYDPNGELAASSTRPATDELIDIARPMDGTWSVYVHGWLTPGGDSDYSLQTWVVSATPGGSLSIVSAPESATLGATETIEAAWSGLASGTQYLGAVSHNSEEDLLGLTLVSVNVK